MLDVELLRLLDRRISLSQRALRRYDAYYEGSQPLRYMAPALEAEIGDRVTQLVINWPRMCVDAYENRLDISSFRFADAEDVDADLWEMFAANDGVRKYQEGHVEFLVCGRFYVIVGAPEVAGDAPVMTVEHPSQMAVRRDPKTREVTEALKRWQAEDGSQWANLYVAGRTLTFVKRARDWVVDEVDDHGSSRLLVTEFLNRGRILRKDGVSEFHDVIPIADAANKMATDMMISGEFHAMPRRYAIGVTEADFVDEDNNPLSTWSAVAGRLWSTSQKPSEVSYGQFAESDLAVFHSTIKVLAQLAAQLMYLPQDYMSFTSDNPTSADAQRASESRMIKRAERMQTNLGADWKKVQRDMLYVAAGGTDDPRAATLEVNWRNAATPTIAQVADASVKLTQGDRPIIDVEQAQEDLGYTPGQIRRMAERARLRRDSELSSSLAELFRQDPVGSGFG